jgi:hypothetical protein
MKKKILKNLLVLCFAFGGLFLIGNNVMARDVLEKPGPGGITCHQYSEFGRCNVCWENTTFFCQFTG